jgi:hypothetical protein
MFSFKNAVNSISDIPEEWIFKTYLNISQPLDGRPIRMKSVFQEENTPSMYLYYKGGKYRVKDFSSGVMGDARDLVKFIEEGNYKKNLSWADVEQILLNKYRAYIDKNGTYHPSKVEPELALYKWDSAYTTKAFDSLDSSFWGARFGINRDTLNYFNVKRLTSYQLTKRYQNNINKTYREVLDEFIYGYFDNSDFLHTIYQPFNKDLKFIKLETVVYGLEQLNYKTPYLLIGSSLKDIMAMHSLGLSNVEFIAPPSESTMIKKELIDDLKKSYRKVIVLFDNDVAGIKAMQKYKNLYGLDFVYCPYEKDIADFVEKSGQDPVRTYLSIKINQRING